VTAYGTRTEHGGGNSRRYTAAVGFGDLARQRFNVLATFDYERTRPSGEPARMVRRTAIRPDLGFSRTSGNVFPANFPFRAAARSTSRQRRDAFPPPARVK